MGLLSRAARVGPLALTLAVIASTPVAASAGAGASEPGQPDGWVRFKSYQSPFGTYPNPTAWTGDNVYDATGRTQTQSMRAAGAYERGTRLVYVVAIQNDGSADSFLVKATGTGSWSVAYFARHTDVTREVVEGTYRTARLQPGERAFIKVKVRLGGAGSSVMRRIAVSSVKDPARQDVVRVAASYSACGC
jgi:hypothetical protein